MLNTSVIRAVFAGVLAVLVLSVTADAAELTLRCTGRDGSPVSIKKAELLASGWGYAGSAGLKTDGDTLTMPLDGPRIISMLGEDTAFIEELFLYVEADGYAPARSAPFPPPWKWAGEPRGTVLGFPGGTDILLAEGKSVEAALMLRKQARRSLLLQDENGPVQGVEVRTYMYWSSSNHCARLSGARLLDTSVSGGDGLVDVPDGEFEYAFEVAADDMGFVLRDPELPEYPERLVTELYEEKTVVELHRRKSATLSMRVTKNGVPVIGETLYGCLADCPGGVCASCCGPLAATGPYGVITVPGFYPEAYKSIYIQDGEGVKLFEADPAKLPLERPIEVDLAFCLKPGDGI